MRTLVTLLLALFFTSGAWAAPLSHEQLVAAVQVAEVAPHRSLPHAFLDQELLSIPELYRDVEILESSRDGENSPYRYSYLAYREGQAQIASLALLATDDRVAWRLSASVPVVQYQQQFQVMLEVLSSLDVRKSGSCAGYVLPTAPALREPPPPQPYERLYPSDKQLNLGIGHLRPLDDYFYQWDWYRRMQLPLYNSPGGGVGAWLSAGWIVDNEGRHEIFSTAGMIETGYETPSFIVLAERDDAWLQVRIAEPGSANDTAWVHRCALGRGPLPLQFERWEQRLLEEGQPLYFRDGVRHSLRAGPGVEHERLGWVPAEDNYDLFALEVVGDWMRVRLVTPSSACGGDEKSARQREGWVKWRDKRLGTWLYYPTRGC